MKNRISLRIGNSNSVVISRIVGIFSINTNPIKKMVCDAKAIGNAIDLTKDKKCKSVILLDNDYIILSSLRSDTLDMRLNDGDSTITPKCDESKTTKTNASQEANETFDTSVFDDETFDINNLN